MVTFGAFSFPHVLNVQIQSQYRNIERAVPTRTVAYRQPQATLGRVVTVSGEIRETNVLSVSDTMQDIRDLNDGTVRSLDLEDGDTTAFNALLANPEFELNVENWLTSEGWIWGTAVWGASKWGLRGKFRVPYTVTLMECVAP